MKLIRAITLGLSAVISGYIHAAPEFSQEEKPWYQVEVIVFSQTDTYKREANRPADSFHYPHNLIFLDPGNTTAPAGEINKLSSQDRQLYELMIPPQQLKRISADTITPYLALNKSARNLNPDAYSLNRTGVYRVLFHQAWRQQMDSKKTSPWIFINGGKTVDNHHQMEGSLRIYLSRFYHFEVNLWNLQFENASDETGKINWPSLPEAPTPSQIPLPAFLTENFFALERPDMTEPEMPVNTTPYRIADIDSIRQSIRIDTKTLHYLDHPRLGILVQVKPYNQDEIAAQPTDE